MKTEGEETRDSERQQPFNKPNIEAIAALIGVDGSIHNGEVKAQRAAADNAKIYTQIEKDHHGNKDAVKAVRRLIKMGQAAADDFMRTFEPLCDHFNLYPPADLVDQAQGKGNVILSGGDRGTPQAVVQTAGKDYTPEPAAASDQSAAVGGDDDDEGDEDEGGADDADPAPASNVTPFRSALDAARGHFGNEEPKAEKPARKPRTPRGGGEKGASVH